MAAPGNEIDLLPGGTIDKDAESKGWAQNTWRIQGVTSVRPGWGQVAEMDTTLGLNLKLSAAAPGFESQNFGYREHLGSHYIKTVFGHEHVVSLFSARCSSGNMFGENKPFRWDHYLVARIYDLTTNRSWEEVLHRHTSEKAISGDIESGIATSANILASLPSQWFGCYESSNDRDNTTFVPSREDGEWFFQVYQNNLYFGASGQGVYMYQPADFKGLRNQQVETSNEFAWSTGYSESSLIKRLGFSPGIYQDGFLYADDSALGGIRASCVFRDRIAFATEHQIFFSDPGRVSNVIAINFIQCPSARKITAIAELRGNLVIFTSHETYLYIPSEGTVVSRGRPPVNVSNDVGCVAPQATTHADNSLVWVSHSGVYNTTDGVSLTEISKDIRSFWPTNGEMTNPMTSYFETALQGHVDIAAVTPPRTLLSFDPSQVTIAYNQKKKAILLGAPNLNGAWCLSGSQWSWWSMESLASESGGHPVVNTSQNLLRPFVLSSRDDFYAVCGVYSQVIQNDAMMHLDGNPVGDAANSEGSNFVLARLGRGGGLDRSSGQEDDRLGSGSYITVQKGAVDFSSRLYFRPFEAKESASGDVYWVQMEYVPKEISATWSGLVVNYSLHFKYDSSVWQVDSDPVTAVISYASPAERVKSNLGFIGPFPLGVFESDAGGIATPGGGYISVNWSGAAVPLGTYANQPNLNLTALNKNPLIRLPFYRVATTTTMSGFGFLMLSSSFVDSLGNLDTTVPTLAWTGMSIGSDELDTDDKQAQAVDWAIKSAQIDGASTRIRARGVYADVQGRGRALTLLTPAWLWGVYNVLLGSDSKGYTTQVVDYDDNITTIQDKLTIRSRFRAPDKTMQTRTFGDNADHSPRWGSIATQTDGDYLIDDTQTDTIAISDSVKGRKISYMFFGFIRNRAQALTVLSLKGVFRIAGGRRRIGR